MQPITECSNVLSWNIDVAGPQEIVKQLQDCDAEIFNGWKDYPSIKSEETIQTIGQLAQVAATILKDPSHNCIVLSGCGTSGRLAFLLSRSFNRVLTNQGLPGCYEYIVAGGDKALLTSQEAPEDDPHAGIKALKEVTEGKQKVLLIGITCGLSAPFVAGQLEYCMDHPDKFIPVLLGFNPIHLARNIAIENWDKTFLDVARKLENDSKDERKSGFILNPVVGPEPITGSSRMKSGSATKILLETIFTIAHQLTDQSSDISVTNAVKGLLSCYQTIYNTTYTYSDQIVQFIDWAGKSLNNNGHVYYIGVNSLGIVGIIDATECPPTYGATLEDIRGFVVGGYQSYGNKEGSLVSLGEPFNLAAEHFQNDMIDKLTSADTVLFLLREQDLHKLRSNIPTISESVLKHTNQFGAIFFKEPQHKTKDHTDSLAVLSHFKHHITVELPWQQIREETTSIFHTSSGEKTPVGDNKIDYFETFLIEICLKWILNSISTGGHIQIGKVYKNFMVDVKVSNNKLYHRAIGIVQKSAECSPEEARSALLKSIYSTDSVSDDQNSAVISQHIDKATSMNKVVPTALVLAVKKCSLQEARQVLQEATVVSKALQVTKESGNHSN
ncbi:glucokinase regulatory protein-like [Glandiceps talaboti]